MDLAIAFQLGSVALGGLSFAFILVEVRAAKKEIKVSNALVLDCLGLIRADFVASTSLRSRTTIPEPNREKLQLLRVTRPIPDPSARRLVDVTPDSEIPTSEGVIVDIDLSLDEIDYDTSSGRWLQQVLEASRRRDSDTPAPPGQRAPILPTHAGPPSSSSGTRHRLP